jgi:hypothetical protein
MSRFVSKLRSMTIAATVAAFVVTAATAVTAGPGGHTTEGAHFNSANGSVNANGALVVTWDEAGVGDNAFIDYSLALSATATYACINGGGNHPKASNKESVNATTTTDFTAEAKNGRVIGEFTTGPLTDPSFTCPSGQRRVLACVSYSDLTLTDTTNDDSVSIADVSRTFVPIAGC